MSSFMSPRSSTLRLASNGTSRWRTNGDSTTALTIRPMGPTQRPVDSPLLSRSIPAGVSARRQSDGERVPASCRTRSYRWPLWTKSSLV
jgi:hypothetical protein